MSVVFVTSTGTGIGKTFVCCALVHQLRTRGIAARAIKPVVSGFDPDQPTDSDCAALAHAQGLALCDHLDELSPWRYQAPLAPHMAAAAEGRSLPYDALLDFCRAARRDCTHLIIEGVGGVMVPLDERHTVLDWIAALGAPALLVVGSYLGTLSHTLTACAALETRGVRIQGILVSESSENAVDLGATCQTLGRFLPTVSVTAVTRLPGHQGWRNAPDLVGVAGLELRS